MLTDKHISIKRITKEDNEKNRFQKAINEMLSKPASERTQAAMDRLITYLRMENNLKSIDSSYQD